MGKLQEVFSCTTASGWDSALVFWNGAEDAELWVQILTDVHDGSNITAAVAVIGCGPDGNNGLLGEVIL
jgi:hypothetical protein